MNLQGRIALVTGGARRLGRHVALALAAAGADVAISFRSSGAEGEKTAHEIRAAGRRGAAIQCDVRNAGDVAQLVAAVAAQLGPIDVLVANAAVFRRTPFRELSDEDWDLHLDTNLRGTFICAREAAKAMRGRGGSIVLIADTAGLQPWPSYLPYSVSKAGVIALTRALAVELAPEVRVNAVAPGFILPPEGRHSDAPQRTLERTLLHRPGTPEDIGGAVIYLATADYVTGAVLPVDGGRHLG